MDPGTTVLFESVPILVPLVGIALPLVTGSIIFFVGFMLFTFFYPAFAESISDGNMSLVIAVNGQAIGSLGQAVQVAETALSSIKNAVSTLVNFDYIRGLVAVLIAAFCVVFIQSHDVILHETFTFTMCQLSGTWETVSDLLNAARLLAGLAWPVVNFVIVQMYILTTGILEKTITVCVFGSISELISEIANTVATMVVALATALTDFFDDPVTMESGRIDFLPFWTAFGELGLILSSAGDCFCSYLNFIWTDAAELLQLPALHYTLDCALNLPVRLLQALFNAVANEQAPNFENFFVELTCVELNLGDLGEDVVLFVLNVVNNIIELIPAVVSQYPDVSLMLESAAETAGYDASVIGGNFGLATGGATPALVSPEVRIAATIMTLRYVQKAHETSATSSLGIARTTDFSNFTIPELLGLTTLIRIAESDWSRTLTEPVAGLTSVLNGTVALVRLFEVATFTAQDRAFFEVGHIFDRFRNGAYAAGRLLAASYEKIEYVAADVGVLAAGVVQVGIEVVVELIFYNAYEFDVSDPNPFKSLIPYCNSTGRTGGDRTRARKNYALLYNHSAEIAEFFGCEWDGVSAPLFTKAATCSDSVLGCLAMSTYRVLIEAMELVLRITCYLSEIVQFDPTKTTFEAISLDGLFRQMINLADCLRRLFYLLDIVDLGDPSGELCEYLDGPSSTNFKKSLMCALANIVQLSLLAVLAFLFELTLTVKTLLAIFPYVNTVIPLRLTSSFRIPTLADTLRNLDAALCQLGAFVGSVLPISFECDAGRGSTTAPSRYRPLPLPIQILKPVPVVDVSRRHPVGFPWFFEPTAWGALYESCNCSALDQTWRTDYIWYSAEHIAPDGYTRCMVPCNIPAIVEFPFRVGLPELPLRCRRNLQDFPVVSYQFSNMSTLAKWMVGFNATSALDFPLPIIGLKVDAPPSVLVYQLGPYIYSDDAMFKILAQARYNIEANLIFSRGTNLRFSYYGAVFLSGEYCRSMDFITNTFNDDYGATMAEGVPVPERWLITLEMMNDLNPRDIVAIIENIIAPFYISYIPAMRPYKEAIRDCLFVPMSMAYRVATELIILGDVRSIDTSDGTLAFFIRDALFNLLKEMIEPGYDTSPGYLALQPCFIFQSENVSEANGFPPAFPYNASDTGPFDQVCTRNMSRYVAGYYNLPSGGCDCNNLTDTFYSTNDETALGSVGCLNECNPFQEPIMYGRRSFDGYMSSNENTTMITFANNAILAGFLAEMGPSLATFPDYRPLVANVNDGKYAGDNTFVTSSLLIEFITAHMNVYHQQRYRPGINVYFRTIDDPLFTAERCMPLRRDRELWAGVRWDIALDVINRTFLGSRDNSTCGTIFKFESTHYAVCQRLQKRFNFPFLVSFLQRDPDAEFELYTRRVDPGEWERYENYTRDQIIPMLQLMNNFRPNCNSVLNDAEGNECFVISTFTGETISLPRVLNVETDDPDEVDLEPLDFVGPQYDKLVEYDPRTMGQCFSTITCAERTFCTVFRMFIVPFVLLSDILEQINVAIQNGQGQWTLGTGFWEVLKKALNQVWIRFAAASLALLSTIDCVACAIAGNTTATDLCNAPFFNLFQPLIVTLYEIGTAFINTAVDIVRGVVLLVVYFFSFNFEAFVETLIDLFISIFTGLILPVLRALLRLLISYICLCDVWNVLAGEETFTCDNAPYCNQRKRSTTDFSSYWDAEGPRHMYQTFAPDWPSNTGRYTWPDAHPCTARMTELAPRAPNGLTEAEAFEVAYCLGGLVLFEKNPFETNAGTTSSTTSGNKAFSYDKCAYMMRETGTQNVGFQGLPLTVKADLLQCINDRGTVHVFKETALDGSLDWMPRDAFSFSSNPLKTGIQVLFNALDGAEAAREQQRDAVNTPTELASVEYQARLQDAYSPERAHLAERTAQTGSTPSVDEYADAISSAGSGRKRSTVLPSETKKTAVRGFARFVRLFQERVLPEVGRTVVDTLDQSTASLPPLYQVVSVETGEGQETLFTSTKIAETERGGENYETTSDLNRQFKHTLYRAAHGAYRVASNIFKLSYSDDENAVSLRRSVLSLSGPRAHLRAISAVSNGVFMIGMELFSGRAFANATANREVDISIKAAQIKIVQDAAFSASLYAATHNVNATSGSNVTQEYLDLVKLANTPIAAVAVNVAEVTKNVTRIKTAINWQYAKPRYEGTLMDEDFAHIAATTTHEPIIKWAHNQMSTSNRTNTKFWQGLWGPRGSPLAKVRRNVDGLWAFANTSHSLAASNDRLSERTHRMEQVRAYVGSIFNRWWSKYYNRQVVAAFDPSSCLSPWPDLCENCIILDRYIGFEIENWETLLDFLFSMSPRPEQRLSYLISDFLAVRTYVLDDEAPVRVGDSPNNPIRFPSPYVSSWAYIRDPIPNKIRFDDKGDLFNRPINFFLDTIGGFNFLSTDPVAPATAAAASLQTTSSDNSAQYAADVAAGKVPPRLLHSDPYWAENTLMYGAVRMSRLFNATPSNTRNSLPPAAANVTLMRPPITTAAEFFEVLSTELFTAIMEIADFFYKDIYRCSRLTELNGSELRFSLGEAAVITFLILSPLLFLAAISPLVASFVFTPWFGFTFVVFFMMMTLAISTGWSILCFPMLPPVLFNSMATHFLFEVAVPKCPVWGAGLINEATYTNTHCIECEYWQNEFTFANCRRNLGWEYVSDPFVFALRQWAPDFLSTVRDPNFWPPILNTIIGSDAVQEWLTRFDNLNIQNDPIAYSKHWTCFGVILFPNLGLLYFLVTFLPLAYVGGVAAILVALLLFVVKVAFYFIFGSLVLIYVALRVPPRMAARARLARNMRRALRRTKAALH